MKILKKILNIAVNTLIIFIFVASVCIIIANASKKDNSVPNLFGYTFFSVQSDSMTPTIKEGSIIIGKIPDEDTEIKKDDIVSFYQRVDDKPIINTHRVIDIKNYGEGLDFYQTQGDKEGAPVDDELKARDDIISVHKFHIGGVGKFIDFVREPAGFVLCIVLPFLIVIVWEIYRLIALYMDSKKQEIMEQAGAEAQPSDEMKDAIIREYLEAQKAMEQAEKKDEASSEADNTDSDNNND